MNSNTETVQAAYAAFAKGDVAGILAKLTDDVLWIFEAPEAIAWSGTRRGKQEKAVQRESNGSRCTCHA